MSSVVINSTKTSPSIGAAYAIQGIYKAMPFYHAPPGCTFLSKVLLTQHFMEPVAISGSDTKEIATIFGSSEEVIGKIEKIVNKNKPEIIFILTSSVAEVRGEDIQITVNELKEKFPGFPFVHVVTPDFSGGFADGFSRVVLTVLQEFLPHDIQEETGYPNLKFSQATVLPAPFMTPADISHIEEILNSFGISSVVLPDISRSMDGSRSQYGAMAHDGFSMKEIERVYASGLILSFSDVMTQAGDWLKNKTGAEHIALPEVYGVKATDRLFHSLIDYIQLYIQLRPEKSHTVAERWKRGRSRLLDLLVDIHSRVGEKKAGIALDDSQSSSFISMLLEMGLEIKKAVAPNGTGLLKNGVEVQTGTLYDIEESLEKGEPYDLLISNSHGKELSQKYSLPLIRAGFPVYDSYGANLELRVGYEGAIHLAKEIANKIIEKNYERELT